MSFIAGEKIVQAALVSGLTTIKADLDTYIPYIFEPEIYNANYQLKIKTFLGGNKITIKRSNPQDASHFPGWFAAPVTNQNIEQWAGSFISDEDEENEIIEENYGILNRNSIRLITASDNADITVFLDAIARYILYSGMESLAAEYALSNFRISVNDIDPIIQYLPENHFYRASNIEFEMIDSWNIENSVVGDIETYITVD